MFDSTNYKPSEIGKKAAIIFIAIYQYVLCMYVFVYAHVRRNRL